MTDFLDLVVKYCSHADEGRGGGRGLRETTAVGDEQRKSILLLLRLSILHINYSHPHPSAFPRWSRKGSNPGAVLNSTFVSISF